jgi:hypothetical protein
MFGPMKDCIQKVTQVVSNKWFHGFLSSEEADKLLDAQPIGTFLVRFSRSNNGAYALAYVDPNGKVAHSLVRFCPPNGYSITENDEQNESNRVFSSLDALIKNYSYILKTPFLSSLSRENWFHGDLDNVEAVEILRDKPKGTFLFRFSSKKGFLTASVVLKEGEVQHFLVQPLNNAYLYNGTTYPTLRDLVKANQDIFQHPIETLTFLSLPSRPDSRLSPYVL